MPTKPSFTIRRDGSITFDAPPKLAHARLDQFRLKWFERAFFALCEQWIDRRLKDYRARSVSMADGQRLDDYQIAFPRTVNEKFAWRKVFDHDPRFPIIIDKIEAKTWVAKRVPDLSITRLYWGGTDPAAIPDSILDRHAVMKPAHGCAHVHFIAPGKSDMATVRMLGKRYLDVRWGAHKYQWGYFPIPPRVLIEEEMRPAPDAGRLEEIKLYLFNGRIERIIRIFERFGDQPMAGQAWDADATGSIVRSDAKIEVADIVSDAPPPATWGRVIDTALTLGREFDHMRVDLLTDGQTVWLGELTVYSEGGRLSRVGTDPDAQTCKVWDIRESWFLRTRHRKWRQELYRRILLRTLNRAARVAARS